MEANASQPVILDAPLGAPKGASLNLSFPSGESAPQDGGAHIQSSSAFALIWRDHL